MGLPCLSIAPSAMITMLRREPLLRLCRKLNTQANLFYIHRTHRNTQLCSTLTLIPCGILYYLYVTRKTMLSSNLTSPRRAQMWSSHPSSGGASGIKTQSAPDARADTTARYLPSTTHYNTAPDLHQD